MCCAIFCLSPTPALMLVKPPYLPTIYSKHFTDPHTTILFIEYISFPQYRPHNIYTTYAQLLNAPLPFRSFYTTYHPPPYIYPHN